MEWTGHMVKREADYRREVPEGKVVDRLREWVRWRSYVPAAMSEKMFGDILVALEELDEVERKRIEVAQELWDRRFGEKKDNVAEIKEDEELKAIYAGYAD
jgi:hypothetical protein